MLWDVDTRQHLRHPVQFGAGIHPGIFTFNFRMLSSPSICSRFSWVNAICEAISSLLGHETHETIMSEEKSKRESSPWLKRKKKSPDLKNRTIQSRKQRKCGSLLISTLLDVFFFLSFSPLPLCCRITRARLRFSHYQSGQSAIRYNKSWLIMQCWMPFPANSKLFCHKPSSGSLTSIFIGRRHHGGMTAFTPALTRCEKV